MHFVRSKEMMAPSVRAMVGEPQNGNMLEVRLTPRRLDVELICAPRRNQGQDHRTGLAVGFLASIQYVLESDCLLRSE